MATQTELEVVLKLKDEITGTIHKFNSEMSSTLSGIADKMNLFGGIMAGIGTVTAGYVMAADKHFSGLNTSVRKAGSNIRATEDEISAMTDMVLELGQNSKFSFEEIADGLYEVAGGTNDFNATMALYPSILKFAEVNNLEFAEAATIADQAILLFNQDTDGTIDTLDLLTRGAQIGHAKVDQLSQSFDQAAPMAAQLGWDLDELVGTLVALGDAGFVGEEAGTAIKRGLSQINTKTAQKQISELGINMTDFYESVKDPAKMLDMLREPINNLNSDLEKSTAIKNIFGQGAAPAFTALLSQADNSVQGAITNLNDYAGTVDYVKGQLNEAQPPLERLGKSMESIQLSIGKALHPISKALSDAIEGVAEKLAQFVNDHPQIAQTIAGIGLAIGALGAVLVVLAGIITAVSAVMSAGLLPVLTPILLIVGAITAALLLFKLAWDNNFLGIQDGVKALGDMVKPFFEWLGQQLDALVAWWNDTAKPWIDSIAPLIQGAVDNVMGWIRSFFEEHSGLIDTFKAGWEVAWNLICAAFKIVWDVIKGVAQIAWSFISGVIETGLKILNGDWKGAWDTIKKTFEDIWNAIWKTLESVWNTIKDFWKKSLEDIKTIGKNLVTGLWDGISSMTGWIGEKISGFAKSITDKFKDVFDIGSPSKVFAEIGKFNIEGLEKGMQDAINSLDIPSMTASIVPQFQSGMANSGFSDSHNTTVNITGDIVMNDNLDVESVAQFIGATVANAIY